MDNCNISVWNNTWSDQFDFTPNKGNPNYKFMDSDGTNFIDSFKTITHTIMAIQAASMDPSIDLSTISLNFDDENEAPLIPITTGNLPKPAQCHAFILFHASDFETVHQIYEYLFHTYFKGRREEYWLKETREVQLKDPQLTELLNIDSSDQEYNERFFAGAQGKSLIGFHICAATDTKFANEIAGYLSSRHVELEFYLSFKADAVQQQSVKFFKEYNKEDKGNKIG